MTDEPQLVPDDEAPGMVRHPAPREGQARVAVAPRRTGSLLSRPTGATVLFVAPGVLVYVVFMFLPLVATVVLSFSLWSGFNVSDIHLGTLENYSRLRHDPVFKEALEHTLVFVVAGAVIATALSLVLALVLFSKLAFARFFRVLFVMPAVISPVVIGLIFVLMLDPNLGAINPFLQRIGLGHFAGVWLSDPHKALVILILVQVWATFGLYMLLFISRLGLIDDDQWDAASVDGASYLQTLWSVVLPQMQSVIGIVLLLALIDCTKVFNTVFVMTSGGPNHATEVLSTWSYTKAFGESDVGYGDAIATVLLAVAFVFIVGWALWMRWSAKRAG
jgi:raffinose/stachyose/melibiose transport system permease protein